MDAKPKRRFQFSLRQMFMVSALTACAFASFGWFCRIVASNMLTRTSPTNLEVTGTLLLLLATGGLLGAAIGTLIGRIRKSILCGIVVGIIAAAICIIDKSPPTTNIVIPAGGKIVIPAAKTNNPPPAAMPP